VALEPAAAGGAGEQRLGEAGGRQRVGEPEQQGEGDEGDRRGPQVVAQAVHQKSWSVSPCTTGPSREAGKKVRAATNTTAPSRRTTKVGESARKVPAPAGATRLPASEPATASTAISGRKRPNSITRPPSRLAKSKPSAPALPGAFGCRKPV